PRSGNGSHQLPWVLGQSVAPADDGGRLRADAGTACPGQGHGMLSLPSPAVTRTFVEDRGFGSGFRASGGVAPAASVSCHRHFSSHRLTVGLNLATGPVSKHFFNFSD